MWTGVVHRDTFRLLKRFSSAEGMQRMATGTLRYIQYVVFMPIRGEVESRGHTYNVMRSESINEGNFPGRLRR